MYAVSAVLIGFASAILAGMFGIGGASLTTPALRLIMGVSPALALGTPLPVGIPVALAGAATYCRRGFINRRLAFYSSLGGVGGSLGGAGLTGLINKHYLMLITGAVLLYLAGITLYRGVTGKEVTEDISEEPLLESPGRQPCEVATTGAVPVVRPVDAGHPVYVYLLVGLGAGFFSGLLGLGGGVVLVPGFLYLLKVPIKVAFGTSLAVIGVIAVPGTIIHVLYGHISWQLFLYLSLGVVPGAIIGARISIRAGERFLYTAFGVLLSLFAFLFIANEVIELWF